MRQREKEGEETEREGGGRERENEFHVSFWYPIFYLILISDNIENKYFQDNLRQSLINLSDFCSADPFRLFGWQK